jgi:DNA (cytosine-5)-methyltransferase 1
MKSVELFAGAGGLAIATANAGFEHEAVLEWNRNACDTIRHNRDAGIPHVRDWTVVEGDVCDYDFKAHAGSVEFVSGGPPCQPFSIGGKHRGMDDSRDMFPQAVRAVREIRPKAFLFENVKGLTRKSFSNYFQYVRLQLCFPEVTRKVDENWVDHLARLEKTETGDRHKGLKYKVVTQLLNAADFGVPQRRERVLFVGVRADLGIEFCFPAITHSEDAFLHAKWVSGEYWERHRIARKHRPKMPVSLRGRIEALQRLWFDQVDEKPWSTVRDAIFDLPKLNPGETCEKFPNHFYNPGAKIYAGHNGSPLDEPAKTLKAGDHGVPGGENMLRDTDGSVRYFSVRECARLQTFPDCWVLQGSWTESMRQLGNAVPVRMVEAVARDLHRMVSRGDTVMRLVRENTVKRHVKRNSWGKLVT